MKASEAKLRSILHSPNRYIVPVFQRYYSWEKENWEQLWEDIEGMMALSQENQNPSHFMGSLVFVPMLLTPNNPPTFQIIDGQQRMMTLIILLCALRNVAESYGFTDLVKEILNNYIIHEFNEGVEQFKVYPRHQDKEDFLSIINGDKEPGNNVGKALTYFTRNIFELPNLSTKSSLRQFLNLIVGNLEFVHITLTGENPYQIFRSLNSTGVDLSEGDLIRNYVFMHLKPESQADYDDKYWKPLEMKFTGDDGNLDGKLISSFFRDFLMRNGEYVRQSETYKTFENTYPTGTFEPYSLVKELHIAADTYNIILGNKKHPNKEISATLDKLRELDSSTTYPLVLKLLLIDQEETEIAKVINWIASFILRRFICSDSSRAYGRWFVSACQELSKNPIEKIRVFLLSKGFPGDERFKEQFLTFNLYGRRYTKAILARIELDLGHKEPVDLSNTEVEHIMPQRLTKTWQRELGARFNIIHETWLHTIGNLTLSGYNPELSNKSFTKKKGEYANSNITLTKKIAEYAKWNEKSIKLRAEWLINKALIIWDIPENLIPIKNASELSTEIAVIPKGDQVSRIQYMLTRIPIQRGQRELYRILYDAGSDGISWIELANKMQRTRKQMSGVMGALGVRINNTDGLDDGQGIAHVFEYWQISNEWHYRMKPELREAIELEGIV